MLVWYERLFITSCNLFGMRIFKKYWPVGGSFWKETHIDPKNRFDLENVIKESWQYTQAHVIADSGIIFSIVWLYFLGERVNIAAFLPMFVLEIYAYSAHTYNRILAREALENLSKEDTSKDKLVGNSEKLSKIFDKLNKINMDNILKVTNYSYGGQYKSYYISIGYRKLGKYFETIEEAVKFRESLYDKYGDKYITYLNLDL